MLCGLRGLPATTTMLAAAMLLGMTAGTSTAASGGAGLAPPAAPNQVTAAPSAPAAPALSPVASIPQLAAGVTLRKISKRAVSAATLTYVSHARATQQVRVDVVRLADGFPVFTDERTVAPEA